MDHRVYRKVHIDFLRIIAIFMVLFNHTGTRGFILFTVAQSSPLYPLYLANAVFIKVAVPLFFMISGALLIGKEESCWQVLRRFFKYLFILISVSFVLYLYRCFREKMYTFCFTEFLVMIYKEPVMVALWYMYTYLAFLLTLPVLRYLAKSMDREGYMWFFWVYCFISLLPILEFIIWKGAVAHYYQFSVPFTSMCFFYPMMGYFIENKLGKSDFQKSNLLILTVASLFAVSVCAALTHWQCTIMDVWTEGSCQTFLSTLTFLPAITVYYATKMFFDRHPPKEKTCKVISRIGKATFGLFLLESICRWETEFLFTFFHRYLPTLLACWIWIFIACTIGIIITLLFDLIKATLMKGIKGAYSRLVKSTQPR